MIKTLFKEILCGKRRKNSNNNWQVRLAIMFGSLLAAGKQSDTQPLSRSAAQPFGPCSQTAMTLTITSFSLNLHLCTHVFSSYRPKTGGNEIALQQPRQYAAQLIRSGFMVACDLLPSPGTQSGRTRVAIVDVSRQRVCKVGEGSVTASESMTSLLIAIFYCTELEYVKDTCPVLSFESKVYLNVTEDCANRLLLKGFLLLSTFAMEDIFVKLCKYTNVKQVCFLSLSCKVLTEI
uniref:Uncharacterized protein n=1 Tax=Glossina palpalis gambiensis TaxID=67801 RepID=A0A1B0C701_9MUSC